MVFSLYLPRYRRRWKQFTHTVLLISVILFCLHFRDISDNVDMIRDTGIPRAPRQIIITALKPPEGPVCPKHVDFDDILKLSENSSLSQIPGCVSSAPLHPPPQGEATKVILVTYQRSGSSFLGELLNQNPDSFYMFEPIDGVYSSVYGTGYGWNVPDHIMSDDIGNRRNHSQVEIEAVANAVKSILTCDFKNIPIQVLTHTFLRVFFKRTTRIQPYVNCLGHHKAIAVSFRCRRFLDKFCPRKYHPSSSGLEFCHDGIFGKLEHNMRIPLTLFDVFAKHKLSYNDVKSSFKDYNECLRQVREVAAGKCIPLLEPICQKSSLHGMKTVRVGMEMAIHMLKYIPDLKIVHNIRDPRGITLSRMRINHGDMMSASSGADIVKEAKILCSTIARHIKLRRALEKLRPGTSMQITYEDFATKPLEKAEEIYKFIGQTLPKEVTDWLRVNALGEKDGTSKARNASAIAQAWENKISFSKAKQIDVYCRTLYDEVSNRWSS